MGIKKALAYIAIMTAVFVSACTKISVDEKVSIENFQSRNSSEKVKAWFYSRISSNVSGRSIVNEDWRTGIPVWDKTQYYQDQGTYITPISLLSTGLNENTFVYKFLISNEDPEGDIENGFFSFIIVSRTTFESENFQISESMLSPSFFQSADVPTGFSGRITNYDLEYTIISSTSVGDTEYDPESFSRIVYKNNGSNIPIGENIEGKHVLECGECADWYEEVYNPITGYIYSETYLYTECGECNPPSGSGGSGGSGGGPGPGTPNPEPCPLAPFGFNLFPRIPANNEPPGTPNPEDPCGPVELEDDGNITCPNNFSFVSVTTNNVWQEAKLTTVYCNLVRLSGGQTTATYVVIPNLYFGLPKNNQNGGTIYTTSQAKSFSAIALNYAEMDMRNHFKLFPNMSAQQLRDYWVSRADFHIKVMTGGAGKVDKTGSINPSNPVPSVPYDPITGSGPC